MPVIFSRQFITRVTQDATIVIYHILLARKNRGSENVTTLVHAK